MRIAFVLIVLLISMLPPCSAQRGLPASVSEPGYQAEIESRLDLGHPDVMRTAVTMARDYPGEFSINQVSAIYRHLVEEKAWNYFNDPSFQEYYKYANQTLEDGYRAGTEAVGDCDDFAILMASLVESLHGSTRIIFAHDEQTGEDHAYAELYVGENGDPIVAKIENFIKDEWGVPSVPGLTGSDDNSLWLNLDYNATYPGGFVFGGERADKEVAWISGNRTSPKIVPLIDSMDSIASWEVVKDDIGSNISLKNAPSKVGKAIEISYDLGEGGCVGISRDVDPKVLAELEGINFTYLMSGRPANLMLVLNDGNSSGYSRSWNLFENPKGDRPKWFHLEGYYDEFQRMDPVDADSSQEKLNRSHIRKIGFIISRVTDGGYISGNGSIALDQIRGVMRIPKDSIWNQVKSERDEKMALDLASKSIMMQQSESLDSWTISVLLAVESLRRKETPSGISALRSGLTSLPHLSSYMNHNDSVYAISFNPDGSILASASKDGTACLWDPKTGKLLKRLECDGPVYDVSFSPDGRKLATAGNGSAAYIWDAQTGQKLEMLNHKKKVVAVAFSPDGMKLATASLDKTACIWDAKTGQRLHELGHYGMVGAVIFSSDSSRLCSGDSSNNVSIWDANTGELLHRLEYHDIVNAMVISPDGKKLAVADKIKR
jgi:hypothetical protein